jgi:hypothetical protein
MPHVGVLVAESAPHPFTEAFRSGMRELGYVEGRTIAIEWRYADALYTRAVEPGKPAARCTEGRTFAWSARICGSRQRTASAASETKV